VNGAGLARRYRRADSDHYIHDQLQRHATDLAQRHSLERLGAEAEFGGGCGEPFRDKLYVYPAPEFALMWGSSRALKSTTQRSDV